MERAVAVTAAWREHFPNLLLAYPYKANPLRAATCRLSSIGAAAEVASGLEFYQAMADGFPAERILFGGPVKREGDLTQAMTAGARIVIDSLSELAKIQALASLLNVRPTILTRMSILSDGRWSRFGLLPDQFEAVIAPAAVATVDCAGIAFHIGSHLSDPGIHAAVVEMYAPLLAHLHTIRPNRPVALDVGGGFPARSSSSSGLVHDAGSFAAAVAMALDHAGVDRRWIELIIEPGRALIEDFGVLVCSVVASKTRDDVLLLFVDAGSAIVPSLSSSVHPFELMSQCARSSRDIYRIYGNLCFESDLLHPGLAGPSDLVPGDILLIGNVGAYDMASGSPWMCGFPAIIAIIEGRERRLREPAVAADRGLA